jgi:hypothetical protein
MSQIICATFREFFLSLSPSDCQYSGRSVIKVKNFITTFLYSVQHKMLIIIKLLSQIVFITQRKTNVRDISSGWSMPLHHPPPTGLYCYPSPPAQPTYIHTGTNVEGRIEYKDLDRTKKFPP